MNNRKIDILIHLVERKLGRGPAKKWKNKDFEQLSFDIHRKTKTLISVATLKRIFRKVKVAEDYQPQTGTLDAIKSFVNYEESLSRYKKIKNRRKWSLVTGLTTLALVGAFTLLSNVWLHDPIQAQLILKDIEGKCPSTAHFNLTIPTRSDNQYIDPGQGLIPVKIESQKEISIFYPIPGLFHAQLKSNKNVLSQPVDVLVQTDGWQAFAYYYEVDGQKRHYPIPLDMAMRNGLFHLETSTIDGLGLDTTQIVVTRLDNYHITSASADRFRYTTMLKNDTFWPGIRCYSAIVTIQGSSGKIEFKLVGKGCSVYSHLRYGEKSIVKSKSLNSLVVDFNQWQDVKLVNNNKSIVLEINQQESFKGQYEQSLGRLVGVTVEFHGCGTVKYINLQSEGSTVFSL